MGPGLSIFQTVIGEMAFQKCLLAPLPILNVAQSQDDHAIPPWLCAPAHSDCLPRGVCGCYRYPCLRNLISSTYPQININTSSKWNPKVITRRPLFSNELKNYQVSYLRVIIYIFWLCCVLLEVKIWYFCLLMQGLFFRFYLVNFEFFFFTLSVFFFFVV